MDLICVDLKMFNHVKLKDICNIHKLNYETMWTNKKNGFAKIWIDKDRMQIIAYTTKKDDSVKFTDEYGDFLSSYVPVDLPRKEETPLNLDDILDKISKSGVSSLTLDERDFLGRFT